MDGGEYVKTLPKILLLSALSISLVAGTVYALPISGGIHFGGGFVPIDVLSTPTSLEAATGIDFTGAVVTAVSGDYASITPFITPVTFAAFQFSPNLVPNPVDPLWSINSGGDVYSFTLSEISISLQDANNMDLWGTGTLFMIGFDSTFAQWTFEGNQGGGAFSFTSIGSPIPGAPEPTSMLLLGTGLVGLAFFSRKRFFKRNNSPRQAGGVLKT
jgi:hypothetical protein